MTRIYVGNLPWESTEDDVRNFFSTYGEVHSVTIVTDRDTGRSRGFAFVEMEDDVAKEAIAGADGQDFGGRSLRVNEAHSRRPGGGGGGGPRRGRF